MRITQKGKLQMKMGISPKMLLEIELLQLSILELSQRMRTELENNPILEEELSLTLEEVSQKPEEEKDKNQEVLDDPVLPLAQEREDEEEWEGGESPPISFWERLEAQRIVAEKTSGKGEFIKAILDNLDGLGFLAREVEELAKDYNLPRDTLEAVRQEIMKNFDPVGVGALNMQELLLIELENTGLKETIVYKIVGDQWNMLQEKGFDAVMDECKITSQEKDEIKKIFQGLYPTPVEKYADERADYVFPEVTIKLLEGKLIAELNDSSLPRFTVSNYYSRVLQDENASRETKDFLKTRLKNALHFLEAIENRRKNIIKVTEFLMEYQKDFLTGKSKFLNPMSQYEAALQLGIPNSTFNRVVNDRYVDTPQGIFELKFFFAKGVLQGNKQVTQDYLNTRIRELIQKETSASPISDKEIAQILTAEGFNISRRTVTEKRRALGIKAKEERR